MCTQVEAREQSATLAEVVAQAYLLVSALDVLRQAATFEKIDAESNMKKGSDTRTPASRRLQCEWENSRRGPRRRSAASQSGGSCCRHSWPPAQYLLQRWGNSAIRTLPRPCPGSVQGPSAPGGLKREWHPTRRDNCVHLRQQRRSSAAPWGRQACRGPSRVWR